MGAEHIPRRAFIAGALASLFASPAEAARHKNKKRKPTRRGIPHTAETALPPHNDYESLYHELEAERGLIIRTEVEAGQLIDDPQFSNTAYDARKPLANARDSYDKAIRCVYIYKARVLANSAPEVLDEAWNMAKKYQSTAVDHARTPAVSELLEVLQIRHTQKARKPKLS